MTPSRTHLVLIPSYNTGSRVLETAQAARRYWAPVWIVIDGSTDGTADALQDLGRAHPGLRILVLGRNRGKGGAILHGLIQAAAEGFSHVLTMDADGQHPAESIPRFMAASAAAARAMILGVPTFDASAPAVRVHGRRISNWWANRETLGAGIADSLCGFRAYPIAPLLTIMLRTRWMRRYDFDAEAAVRLCWRGVPAINLPVPVRYFRPEEGGVSHFRYGRDNALLTWMHVRLVLGTVVRLPILLWRRWHRSGAFESVAEGHRNQAQSGDSAEQCR